MLYPHVSLTLVDDETPTLRLNPHVLKRLGASGMARVPLRFGQARRMVQLVADPAHPPGSVALSRAAAAAICLPEGLPWALRLVGGELLIGPFIGILRFATSAEFNMQTLAVLKDRTLTHPQLRGVIFAFAADQLANEGGRPSGWLFDPETDSWREATLPMPAAVFRHVPLSDSDRDRLLEAVGPAVFNDYHPDKWEVFRWLAGAAGLTGHLPAARFFESWGDVEALAGGVGGQVLLRPLSEVDSGATVLLQRRPEGWAWRRRVHRSWEAQEGATEEVQQAVAAHLTGRRWLVQVWPFPMREAERFTDFHVRVQKDGAAHWQVSGLVARRSGIGGPVANISAGGIAAAGDESLRELLRLDETGLYLVKQRIFDLALRAGERLDRCGVHLGDIAVDIGIDLDRKIWIHNVNARIPDPTVALDVGDRMMYYDLVTQPLAYAKALAGFPLGEGDTRAGGAG